MRAYLDLMRHVLEHGHAKSDRTGTGTLSVFGWQTRYDLAAGFPLLTMGAEGYGEGYRYAHNEEGGVAQGEVYLPDEIAGERFYEPTDRGYEKQIAERVRRVRGEG
mgnify:CR=1 FL=1